MESKKEIIFDEKKCLRKLKELYDLGKQYYSREHRKMKMLDSTDSGDLWKAVRAKFPPYQVLPDTNFVSYVKNNILASIYTVTKSAEIVPTSEEDTAICTQLNVAIEHEWDKHIVGYKQFEAGERAALLNMGLTQVLWDSKTDDLKFKNIDPIRFMRDPFADTLDDAGWCVTYNNYHKSVFLDDPRYKEKFKTEVLDKQIGPSAEMTPEYKSRPNVGSSQDHYNLFIWWIKNKTGGIDEIHTMDNVVLLYRKENIKPNMFPFADLYCNLPGPKLIGISEPAKIFANNLVYNLMQSIAFTSEYKNQSPPKFVSTQSGLNINAFSKHGDEANRTFIVNNDASRAVHYHQFPEVSNALPTMLNNLQNGIHDASGIDQKYTGRDTGSIITTGGTQEMLNRVTLIDTPKVMCYEQYVRKLTELVLRLLLTYAPKRKYLVKDPKSTSDNAKWVTAEIDFPEIDEDTVFDYVVQISSELPKNKQRVQAWADTMMEKQMQYQKEGNQVEIITPEEWIRCQDNPYKEQILERMGVDRSLNAWIEANTVIGEYADMIEQGLEPDEAMTLSAQGLEQMRQGQATPFEVSQAQTENTNASQGIMPEEGMPLT